MIKYYCTSSDHADNSIDLSDSESSILRGMPIEGSECPVCHSRDHVHVCSELYWCDECKIPVYEDCCSLCGHEAKRLTKDIRPVFPEEKLLLEVLLDKQPGEFNQVSIWNGSGNVYYADGKRLPLSIKDLKKRNVEDIRERYLARRDSMDTSFFDEMMKRFVRANQHRYEEITGEAFSYIQRETMDCPIGEMFISFSGGKDSTVVADVVERALSTKRVLHIFGDTTLEFPMTMEYVERYKKNNPQTPVISAKNKDKNFEELCQLLGPPSRVMRWCCTIFKTGAINRHIDKMFRNKLHIVAFQGIRRSESASRSKYEKKSENSKIAKQVTIAPIIDWLDFDVWLYLITTGIDFNTAYRYGYARVGCWCCPNNSDWSQFLSMIYMPEQYTHFRDMLVEFATSIGKPDPEVYVDDGWWKARQGGNGVSYAQNSIVSFEPCVKEENAYNYDLTRPISEELYELFKPFGSINYELGNKRLGEVYVLNRDNVPVLILRGRIGSKALKVSVLNLKVLKTKTYKRAKEIIDCQITKYQMCMGCKACESVCRFDAIAVLQRKDGTTQYQIHEDKCIGCHECINHFTGGCYMRKVLTIKR